MLKIHRKILKEFKDVNAKVILFGSLVKGNYRLDSDIDIAVITNKKSEREKARKIADEVLLKYGKVVSLKFILEEDFNKKNPFIEEIKKGKVITYG